MDDQNMALNEQTEVETVVDTTPVSEETTTVETTTEDESYKKGYSARVQELANAKKAAEEEARSLRVKLGELTRNVPNAESQLPQVDSLPPLVSPGEEVTVDEINRRQAERDKLLLERASRVSQLQSKRELAIERINREAKDLTRKYGELDPQSDVFDSELSSAVTEAAEAYVRANPEKSLEEFVDKQMKLHRRAVTREEKAVQAEVSKQQSQTAIRPSVAKTEDKKFAELSIAEMESKLGIVQ